MRSQINIDVELPDALTDSICSHLAIEFLKHVAYQRQQLPFPYKQIMSIVDRSSQMEDESSSKSGHSFQTIQAQNEYRKVKEVLSSMQSAFNNLEDELRHAGGLVEEIAMVFGATPLSPRDVFRLQFPPLLHGHHDSKHPHQSSLLQLIRCLISSEELHSLFSQPLSPTNMFIFIRKRSNDLASSGFTPKERYIIPPSGKHAIIRLIPPSKPPNCICGGTNIFQDQEDSHAVAEESCEAEGHEKVGKPVVDCWFQCLHSFKGLRDVKINGISAYTMWLQPR